MGSRGEGSDPTLVSLTVNKALLAPSEALIVMMVYYISAAAAAATFSDFEHSSHSIMLQVSL